MKKGDLYDAINACQQSALIFYSYGKAASNKVLGSNELEVFAEEVTPFTTGEITDAVTEIQTSLKDASGRTVNETANTALTIKAIWMPIGSSNRLTSPDVRRGEEIIILRKGNTDTFYWITRNQDIRLRRLETIIFAISATPNEDDVIGPDTTYWLEVSSHGKYIRIHTSKANSEPFAFDVELNTGTGVFVFKNDAGTYLEADFSERRFKYENTDGSIADIVQKTMSYTIPDSISFKTKKWSVDCDEYVLKSTTYSATANASYTIKTPDTLVDSKMKITKDTEVLGVTKLSGGFSAPTGPAGGGKNTIKDLDISGDTTIDGNLDVTQNVNALNI